MGKDQSASLSCQVRLFPQHSKAGVSSNLVRSGDRSRFSGIISVLHNYVFYAMQSELDAILKRIEKKHYSPTDVEKLALAYAARAIAIAGDANNSVIITGDGNEISYILPPEVIEQLIDSPNRSKDTSYRKFTSFLFLLICWVFISILISVFFHDITSITANVLGNIVAIINQSVIIYYQLIIVLIGICIILQFNSRRLWSKTLLLPIWIIIFIYCYQFLLSVIFDYLYIITSKNSLYGFGIVLFTYTIIGVCYIQLKDIKIMENLFLCAVCPFWAVFQTHTYFIQKFIRYFFNIG